MRSAILLVLFLRTTTLSAQSADRGDTTPGRYFGPAIAYEHNYIRAPSFWGISLDFPILSWYSPPSTGPVLGLSDLGDTATRFDQILSYGVGLHWRTRLGETPGLRLGVGLGYRRQSGRIHSRSAQTFENGSIALFLPEQHDFSMDLVRFGGTVDFELISHRLLLDGPLTPTHTPIEEWWSIVFSAGITGVWRAGSNIRMAGIFENPEDAELFRDVLPIMEDGRTLLFYDGPIHSLETLGAEFEGGIAVEFPIGGYLFGSVGITYTQNLFPAALEEWTYRGVGLRIGVGVPGWML